MDQTSIVGGSTSQSIQNSVLSFARSEHFIFHQTVAKNRLRDVLLLQPDTAHAPLLKGLAFSSGSWLCINAKPLCPLSTHAALLNNFRRLRALSILPLGLSKLAKHLVSEARGNTSRSIGFARFLLLIRLHIRTTPCPLWPAGSNLASCPNSEPCLRGACICGRAASGVLQNDLSRLCALMSHGRRQPVITMLR